MPTVAKSDIAFFSATSITKSSELTFAKDHLGFFSSSLKTSIEPSRFLELASFIKSSILKSTNWSELAINNGFSLSIDFLTLKTVHAVPSVNPFKE